MAKEMALYELVCEALDKKGPQTLDDPTVLYSIVRDPNGLLQLSYALVEAGFQVTMRRLKLSVSPAAQSFAVELEKAIPWDLAEGAEEVLESLGGRFPNDT